MLIQRLCSAALLVLALTASAARAEELRMQEATGQAAVLSGDKPAAREKAIEDALRQAVSMAAGTQITSTTEVENFQTKFDEILTRASGYVKGYEVIHEGMDGDVVQVTIRAKVSMGKLDQDLEAAGLLLSRKGKPRTMLLIAEQNIGMTGPYAPWRAESKQVGFDLRIAENVMLDELSKKGFKVIDPEIASQKAAKVQGIATEITAQQARELKQLTGAEVIVIGRVIAISRGTLADLGPEWKSCTATISARAVNTDNGDVLASADTTQQAAALDDLTCGKEAIKKTARAFTGELTGKILARWNQDVSGGNSIKLTVKGQSLHQIAQFRKGIGAQMRGVKSVNQRSFQNGVAEMDVTLVGSTEQFAEELEAKKLGELSVKVKNYSANTVEVELADK